MHYHVSIHLTSGAQIGLELDEPEPVNYAEIFTNAVAVHSAVFHVGPLIVRTEAVAGIIVGQPHMHQEHGEGPVPEVMRGR